MLKEGFDFKIRKMEVEDLEEVARIERESFKEPWPYEALYYELMENVYSIAYVVEVVGRVVGYSFLHLSDMFAHLINIAIDKEFQGRGLAKALLHKIVEFCLDNGFKSIILEVRVSNVKAQNLYKKFDFKGIKIQKNYYKDGEDALIMVKDLMCNETK